MDRGQVQVGVAASKHEMSGVEKNENRMAGRVRRFLHKSWPEKLDAVQFRWSSGMAKMPRLIWLPFGSRWVVRNDNVGKPLESGRYENAELAFAERFLRAGMTVLDVGAHHGLYSLLASRRVGRSGKVYAFEPSARERRMLLAHMVLNGCSNVRVAKCALGSEHSRGELFVVQGREKACNSLRPPVVESGTAIVHVDVVPLDEWLSERGINRVDFIKMDVEGGELAVLEGAANLLRRNPRPVILAEVQDVRTAPWGYKAKEILTHLEERGYQWFAIAEDGSLEYLDLRAEEFEGNFVAFPEERIELARPLMCGDLGRGERMAR